MTWAAYGPPWAAYGPQNPSDDGFRWHDVSEDVKKPADVLAGQRPISAAHNRRPQQDSNLRSRLRRPLLSPLSYGGCATPKGTSHKGRADTSR
jgi:hypothetical protein